MLGIVIDGECFRRTFGSEETALADFCKLAACESECDFLVLVPFYFKTAYEEAITLFGEEHVKMV